MSVHITCPACGCAGDIEAFLADADSKRLASLFAGVEQELGRAVLAYLRLFRPSKHALRLGRAARLVSDLLEMVETGTVCRDERTGLHRSASPGLWTQGIHAMLDQRGSLKLPLTNHHYLRAIVFGLADQHAARAEALAEEQRRAGQHRRSVPKSVGTEPETALQRDMALTRQLHSLGLIDDDEMVKQIAAIKDKYGA